MIRGGLINAKESEISSSSADVSGELVTWYREFYGEAKWTNLFSASRWNYNSRATPTEYSV